jgi:uncharacterized membrane protein YraQ (UPF0718 family)
VVRDPLVKLALVVVATAIAWAATVAGLSATASTEPSVTEHLPGGHGAFAVRGGRAVDHLGVQGRLRRVVRPVVDICKQITPLLLFGVLVAGFLLAAGRGRHDPKRVGGRPGGRQLAMANLFASVVGAFMYFATLDRGAHPARLDGLGHARARFGAAVAARR